MPPCKRDQEREAVQPGSYRHGAVILLSDGRRTTGPDPAEAARMAAQRGVRVYTVGFGSTQGGAAGNRTCLTSCSSMNRRCARWRR